MGRGVLFWGTLIASSWHAFSQDPISPDQMDPGLKISRVTEQAGELKLAQDPEWKRLLHYRKGLLGGEKSDIDGPNFFLSARGRKDPQAELHATINAFFDPPSASTDVQHPRCRYPARYDWLNEKLRLDAVLTPMTCERFESWRDKIDPGSLTLVFSSYYLNNPSTMYGHTFFRVGRKSAAGEARPLLDYTINFAANTNTRNGLAFAVLGLAGGYPGTFTTVPYYMKVQHYSNLESRDLWEYKLRLSDVAIDRLIKHLWEMGPTSMSYYFFNKNCSYQLLPMLEVADPALDLSHQFRFRAIPVDTLTAVINYPGLLEKTDYRPSALQKMRAARDRLNENERGIAESFVVGNNARDIADLPLPRQRAVLDAAYDYLHYTAGFYRNQPAEIQEKERVILLGINALPPIQEESGDVPRPPSPQMSHKTGRWTLGIGASRHQQYEEIGARGALHDLEADSAGFVSGSHLEMMSFRFRIENETGRGYLEDFTGIHVKSLAPLEPWIRKPSWHLRIGYGRAHDLDESPVASGSVGVNGGSGFSVHMPLMIDGILYTMMGVDVQSGHVFRDGYRLGFGPEAGIVGGITKKWRAHFIASYARYGAGDISNANRLRLIQAYALPSGFEVRLSLDRQNHYREGTISLNRYF